MAAKMGSATTQFGDNLINLIGRGQFALLFFDVAFVDDGADVFIVRW